RALAGGWRGARAASGPLALARRQRGAASDATNSPHAFPLLHPPPLTCAAGIPENAHHEALEPGRPGGFHPFLATRRVASPLRRLDSAADPVAVEREVLSGDPRHGIRGVPALSVLGQGSR